MPRAPQNPRAVRRNRPRIAAYAGVGSGPACRRDARAARKCRRSSGAAAPTRSNNAGTPRRHDRRRGRRSPRDGGTPRPADHACLRPGDVAVAQQRDEVVGDRSARRPGNRMPGLSPGQTIRLRECSRGARRPASGRAHSRPVRPCSPPARRPASVIASPRWRAGSQSETGSSRSAAACPLGGSFRNAPPRLDSRQRVGRVDERVCLPFRCSSGKYIRVPRSVSSRNPWRTSRSSTRAR